MAIKFQPAQDTFKFKNVRLAYVHLRTPSTVKQDDGSMSDPKYQVTVLLDKDNPDDMDQMRNFEEVVFDLADESFGDKAEQLLSKGKLHNPLRDGDLDKDQEIFDNQFFVSAGTYPIGFTRGTTVDYSNPAAFTAYPGPAIMYVEAGEKLKTSDPEFDFNQVYPGCYAHVSVTVKTYSHSSGGKGVTCYLKAVLKTKDGEPIGAMQSSVEAEFEEELAELLAESAAAKPKRGRRGSDARKTNSRRPVEPEDVETVEDLDAEEEEEELDAEDLDAEEEKEEVEEAPAPKTRRASRRSKTEVEEEPAPKTGRAPRRSKAAASTSTRRRRSA